MEVDGMLCSLGRRLSRLSFATGPNMSALLEGLLESVQMSLKSGEALHHLEGAR